MRRAKLRRFFRIAAAYLLVAILAALGWLWHSLPSEILLEPGQFLSLPRFSFIEPLRSTGSRNAASTQAVGSYQVTLSLGGWLPIKTVRALVETRPAVTVCGTPFGVKMFSEGALIVGFSDLNTAEGTVNPAKKAGLRLVTGMDGILVIFVISTFLSAGHFIWLMLRQKAKLTDERAMVPYIAAAAGFYLVFLHDLLYNNNMQLLTFCF